MIIRVGGSVIDPTKEEKDRERERGGEGKGREGEKRKDESSPKGWMDGGKMIPTIHSLIDQFKVKY